MKVWHMISGGDAGGAKTHIFSLMKALRGHVEAKVLVFMKDRFYDEAKELGITIEAHPQKSRFDMKVMKAIDASLKEEAVDILHCHGARANFNALFLRSKLPRVTTIHSDYLLDFQDHLVKRLVFTTLNTYALKRFDYYIAITENFRKMLIDRGFSPDRIYVTYNGIDVEKEVEVMEKQEFLQRFSIDPNGRTLFGMAARLDAVKDHRTLLRAIADSPLLREKACFLLAGDGAEREALHRIVQGDGLEDCVHFLGELQDPYSLYEAVDGNLLTSKSESFPYALLEGATRHCATIASRVGGIPEMIRDGEDGWLFTPGDSEDLRRVLEEAIRNPEEMTRRGESMYARVCEKFSEEAMGKSHVAIYEDILRREQAGETHR